MKKKNYTSTICLLFVIGMLSLTVSCNYHEIRESEYPDQQIYMPTAVNGVYDASVTTGTSSVPTPGGPTRFSVDEANGKVIIPLGVYRGGINLSGKVNVEIHLNADTVSTMINGGKLSGTVLLPNDKAVIPSLVEIMDGKDISTFDLKLDLSYLRNNPDKKVAIGISIFSQDRMANPKYATTIVVFNPNSVKQ